MGICKYWFIARNCCYAACHCVETPHQYSIHHRPPQVCTPYTDIGEDLMLSFELCAYPIHSSISHNLLFFVSIFSRLHYTNLLWTSWAIKVDLFFGTTDICFINYLSCFAFLKAFAVNISILFMDIRRDAYIFLFVSEFEVILLLWQAENFFISSDIAACMTS